MDAGWLYTHYHTTDDIYSAVHMGSKLASQWPLL